MTPKPSVRDIHLAQQAALTDDDLADPDAFVVDPTLKQYAVIYGRYNPYRTHYDDRPTPPPPASWLQMFGRIGTP